MPEEAAPTEETNANAADEGGFAQRGIDRVQKPLGGHRPNEARTERWIIWLTRMGRITRWARYILLVVLILGALYLWMRFEIYRIPAGYDVMAPTYLAEDSVLVDRIYEYFPSFVGRLQQGDVVVFVDVDDSGQRREALARIYGLPGQRVDVVEHAENDWRYAVDGVVLPSYGPRPIDARTGEPLAAPGVVPAQRFFVLIENDDTSARGYDSRNLPGGFLPFDNVRGKIALGWGNPDAKPPLPEPSAP